MQHQHFLRPFTMLKPTHPTKEKEMILICGSSVRILETIKQQWDTCQSRKHHQIFVLKTVLKRKFPQHSHDYSCCSSFYFILNNNNNNNFLQDFVIGIDCSNHYCIRNPPPPPTEKGKEGMKQKHNIACNHATHAEHNHASKKYSSKNIMQK